MSSQQLGTIIVEPDSQFRMLESRSPNITTPACSLSTRATTLTILN